MIQSSHSSSKVISVPIGLDNSSVGTPLKVSRSQQIRNVFSNAFSFVSQQARKTPEIVRKSYAITTSIISKTTYVGFKAFLSAEELCDFTKETDPVIFIEKVDKRLKVLSGLQFSRFCHFLSKKVSSLYEKNEAIIKTTIRSKITSDKIAAHLIAILEDYNEDTIKTIEANILHICANLLQQAHLHQETLEIEQQTTDPLLKIIALLVSRSQPHLAIIRNIESTTSENKQEQLSTAFNAWSVDLLKLAFPNKFKDIKFFIRLPIVHLLQEQVWQILNGALPQLLSSQYEEVLPTIKANEHPDWQAAFERFVKVDRAGQITKLPSHALKLLIQNHRHIKWIRESLNKQIGEPSLRRVAVTSIIHLLKTNDPAILQLGSFFESYTMQKLVRNLLQNTQTEAESFLPAFLKKSVTIIKKLEHFQLEEAANVTKDLLSLFGFDKKATVPLPPLVDKMLWSMIEKAQGQSFPQLFKDNLQGFWPYLVNREKYKNEIDELTGDTSLTVLISKHVHLFIEKGIGFLISQEGNLICGDSSHIKLTELSNIQKKQIEDQIFSLLKTSSFSLDSIKQFVSVYIESILYYSILNRYHEFKKTEFQNEAENVSDSNTKFVPWMATQLASLFQDLSIKRLAPEDIAALKRGIALKNDIPLIANEEERSNQVAILENIWKTSCKSIFKRLNYRLLAFLGFSTEQQLPIPSAGQKVLWKLLQSKLPRILFDQAANVMLPFIEKEDCRERLKIIPKGDFIIRACNTIAHDIISVLPYWCMDYSYLAQDFNKRYLEGVLSDCELHSLETDFRQMVEECDIKSKNLLTLIKRYSPKEKVFTVEIEKDLRTRLDAFKERLEGVFVNPKSLLEEAQFLPHNSQFKELIAVHMHSFIQQDFTEFKQLWSFLEGYIEGVLLKIAVKASELNAADLEMVKDKLLQLKDEISHTSLQESRIILKQFVENIFNWAHISSDTVVYGIPQSLSKVILLAAKSVCVNELFRYYATIHKLQHIDITKYQMVQGIPLSALSQAIISLTRFNIESGVDKLNVNENGKKPRVYQLLSATLPSLDHFQQQNIKTAGLFKELIQEGTPARLIETVLNRLHQNDAQIYANSIAEFLQPVLLEHTLKTLNSFLQAEQQNGAAFDQKILIASLPILTDHFKHINRALNMNGGLDWNNFISAATGQIDDAILTESNQQEQLNYKIKRFYQPQTKKLLKLLFPNGKKDLEKLFPELSREVRIYIWRMLKTSIASTLPKMVETMFEPDVLEDIITNTFENLIQNFSEPIDLDESELNLTNEDFQRHKEIDRLVGQFMIEGARFLKFPIDRIEKWPNLLKRVILLDHIKAKTFEVVGKSFRKKFDGQLILESIRKSLPKLASKKYVNLSSDEQIEHRRRNLEYLKQLEHQLVKTSLSYMVRLFGAKIERFLSRFNSRIENAIKQAFIAVWTFIFTKILWPIVKKLKLDQKIEKKLYHFVDQSRERVTYAFKDPRISENLIFRSVNALSS